MASALMCPLMSPSNATTSSLSSDVDGTSTESKTSNSILGAWRSSFTMVATETRSYLFVQSRCLFNTVSTMEMTIFCFSFSLASCLQSTAQTMVDLVEIGEWLSMFTIVLLCCTSNLVATQLKQCD